MLLTCCLIWICGWIAGTRIALAYRMNRTVCTGDHGRDMVYTYGPSCETLHYKDCRVTVGETRPRNLTDGMWAMGAATVWPLLLAARIVIGITPHTPGETQRIIEEQNTLINKQVAVIAGLQDVIDSADDKLGRVDFRDPHAYRDR